MTGPPSDLLPGGSAWLEKHGIDPGIWNERGVWRYEQSDSERVKDAVRPFMVPKSNSANPERSVASQLEWVARMVRQSPGLVMPKHPAHGFPPIAPQLRPDAALVTDSQPRWRFHGSTWGEGEWPVFPPEAGSKAGKYLPRKHVLTPNLAEAHIAKSHDGVNIDVVHRDDKEPAKYLFLPNVAQARLDLHPMAAELMPGADRVFFVLEGALKNDAVLSDGEAVFSVPSVTLWNHTELERFAHQFLQGKVVFVVPDADWQENHLVDQQALFVRTLLRRAGVDAFIAAPPFAFPGKRDRSEKGVDDFLGHGYTVADLEIRGKEAGPGVHRWRGNLDRKAESRASKALEGLSLHADAEGVHRRALAPMMNVMGLERGRRKQAVPDVLHALRHTFEVVDGSLDVETRTWNGATVLEWQSRPTIQLKDEYRPYEAPLALLGDFWSREAHAMAKEAQRRVERQSRNQAAFEATLVKFGIKGKAPKLFA